MTEEEAKSCICTIEMLQRLAYNIHGVIDVIDADNCKKIIKALEQELCDDAISRVETVQFLADHSNDFEDAKVKMAFKAASSLVNNPHNLPSMIPAPKKGKWIKIHTDEKYDFFGYRVKIATYKCSVCGRIIEDIGTYGVTNRLENYPYCHCGAKMESEE